MELWRYAIEITICSTVCFQNKAINTLYYAAIHGERRASPQGCFSLQINTDS